MADRLAHLTHGEIVLGKFQVTATSRRGATSVVIHAMNTLNHRPVALKVGWIIYENFPKSPVKSRFSDLWPRGWEGNDCPGRLLPATPRKCMNG